MLGIEPAPSVLRDAMCVRSGAVRPPAERARNGVAHRARAPLDHVLAAQLLGCSGRRRRRAVRGQPALEHVGRVDDHDECHLRVLNAAVLGALAAVDAGPVGL